MNDDDLYFGPCLPPAPVARIRGTHPCVFRSGEWADLVGTQDDPETGRRCYAVKFSDGATDWWPIEDSAAGYEFDVPPGLEKAAAAMRTDAFRQLIADRLSALLPDDLNFSYEPPDVLPLGQLAKLSLVRPKRVTLHCHPSVIDEIKRLADEPPAKTTFFGCDPSGIDLIVDPDRGLGEWELRENGETVNSGQIVPPGYFMAAAGNLVREDDQLAIAFRQFAATVIKAHRALEPLLRLRQERISAMHASYRRRHRGRR